MKARRLVRTAVRCTICQSPADRIGGPAKVSGKDHSSGWYFRCQKNSNHRGDGATGIFTDLTESALSTEIPEVGS